MKKLQVVVLALGLLVLFLMSGHGGAVPAGAQTVKLRLTSPPGGPSVTITQAIFTKDTANVGEFNGFLAVTGGGIASASVALTDIPNDVDLIFTVPIGGILTIYSVSATDFAFDTPYFLPDPSPGGTVGPSPGDPITDAFFVISLVEPSEDNQSPSCTSSMPEPGLIEFTIQDTGSGLAIIEVELASNADVSVPSFDPGTTDPIIVAATIIDPNLTTKVLLEVADQAGNTTICKRVVWRRSRIRWYRWWQ